MYCIFRWALVKDEVVYQQMLKYTDENCFGVSRDTQLRALKLLKVVLEGEGIEIFGFAHKTMSDRWEKLSEALSSSKRFSIQDLAPQYCSFFQRVRGPSPDGYSNNKINTEIYTGSAPPAYVQSSSTPHKGDLLEPFTKPASFGC
ncbi:hypothetical protein RJ640_029702 [Escallonia rubra]|uniref:Alliinase C-terminal domain-containing protein n=1 Tax=Escallonia rubra TaxID=112253 RepID=A0AA88QR92_9ASTE|nr:hypothetical protein RJ640_029702 [Escallonia rubra]